MSTTEKVPKPHVVRVRISDDEKAWLARHAAADDRSTNYIIRLALREYAERHP